MKEKNRGTAIIEMTILIPIFLMIIYLYIIYFLGMVELGKNMDDMTELLYCEEEVQENAPEGLTVRKTGSMQVITKKQENQYADMQVTVQKKKDSAIKDIRRWQFVTDRIH